MTITIFSGTSGLNNIVDPTRLKLDFDTGMVELAEAVNVTIDQTGRISRRPGAALISLGSFHSMFCDGGDCFVIQERTSDAAIMQLGTDHTLTGVRSSLPKSLTMGWCQVGLKTYYSNTSVNGVIESSISSAWSAQSHVGADTTRNFSGPPLGDQLAFFSGRMWIVNEKFVFYSEPFALGKYDLSRCFLSYGTDVMMFKPVTTGVFVSDSDRTYFIEGTDPKEFRQRVVLDCPAHKYSAAIGYIDGAEFGMDGAGPCAVWSCDKGLCVGTAAGELMVITKDKLLYPTGSRGASVFYDSTVINTVE